MKYNSIKRIISRSAEELRATLDIARVTSVKKALTTFRAKIDIQIMSRNGFKEPHNVKSRLIKKHQIMLEYLEKCYQAYWEQYSLHSPQSDGISKYSNKIWICWWQGLDNAPEIVKVCTDSIKRHSKDYEVICITESNYNEYVQFPEWIEYKRRRNIISRTIFSDLLRLTLLSQYGGIWLDSTFFCTDNCFTKYMSTPLWSIKRPDYLHASVACGYFANYSLGCDYDHRWIFAIIRDFLFYYWKVNDRLIDYLLTDYVIVLAQRHNKNVAEAFKAIVPNNPQCDELYKVLNCQYDDVLWQNMKKETSLFKLSWKQNFCKSVNGHETFYGMLINKTLE